MGRFWPGRLSFPWDLPGRGPPTGSRTFSACKLELAGAAIEALPGGGHLRFFTGADLAAADVRYAPPGTRLEPVSPPGDCAGEPVAVRLVKYDDIPDELDGSAGAEVDTHGEIRRFLSGDGNKLLGWADPLQTSGELDGPSRLDADALICVHSRRIVRHLRVMWPFLACHYSGNKLRKGSANDFALPGTNA